MENDLFVDILRILRSEFIQNEHDITDYLIGISKLSRLQMLVMFCSDNEISCKYVIRYIDLYTNFIKIYLIFMVKYIFRKLWITIQKLN